jgi:hypothetical protein
MEVLFFCVSISLLRILSLNIARLSGDSRFRNLITFLAFSLFYYIMLVLWPIITIAAKHYLIDLAVFTFHTNIPVYLAGVKLVMNEAAKDLHWSMLMPNELLNKIVQSYQLPPHAIDLSSAYGFEVAVLHFARFNMAFVPGLFRLLLSIVFSTSFIARPLIMTPTLLIWERIVESDKPVFTVIFGGAAAFATAISEMAKHL